MSKQKVVIQFKHILHLWQFAQSICCHSMEIIAAERILICECSETDIALLEEYGGLIVENYTPSKEGILSNNKTH